jgi:hypothetical protein
MKVVVNAESRAAPVRQDKTPSQTLHIPLPSPLAPSHTSHDARCHTLPTGTHRCAASIFS